LTQKRKELSKASEEADESELQRLQAELLDLQRKFVSQFGTTPERLRDVPPEKTMLVPAQRARLLFFFILIAQLSDVMQYVWGKLVPARVIAPEINASKTWSGYLGGIMSAAVLGGLLWWSISPFKFWEAALLSVVVAAMGLAGGLTMSAIKRDRGVRDFGTLVVGHGGVLDRIDSVCFAAPAFFYLSRYFLWLDEACISITPW
jgi:CDP-diglyceride synthetase